MSRRARIAVAVTLALGSLVACADIFGVGGGNLEDASIGDASADVLPDVPFDGGYVNPDANYADCGSGTRTLDLDAGLFVYQYGTGSACTQNAPCPKIAQALALAKAGSIIYVAAGTYTETLDIGSAGLLSTIEGGWITDGGPWAPTCDDTQSIIQRDPANTAEWAIRVDAKPTPLTLRLVKILNDAPGGSANGTSVYGVSSNNSALVLDNVSVIVGPGILGVNGDPGTGTTTNLCSPPPPPSSGAVGDDGGIGFPGILTAGSTGFTAVQPGNGSPGTNGANGTAGGAGGSCESCVTCAFACNDGGTGNACNLQEAGTSCTVAGQAGCGGAAGFGGYAAGHGPTKALDGCGGSSVAVYVWQGAITFSNSVTLTAGNAGNGGAGGAGKTGLAGSSGMAGQQAQCATLATCATGVCPISPQQCALGSTYTTKTIPAPDAGGAGGAGGSGGQGGGGAGGVSYGYFTGGNATVNGTPIQTQFGTPGSGGAPNGPNGASSSHN